MINFLAFVAAVCAGIVVFELGNALYVVKRPKETDRLRHPSAKSPQEKSPYTRNAFEALIVALLPARFDPNQATDKDTVESLIRRSGYYYSTVGDFYAAALRDFVLFLFVAALYAGLMSMMSMAFLGIIVGGLVIFAGLRQPYERLKKIAKQRGEALQNNMLAGLTVMEATISANAGLEAAAGRAAKVGGPFCAVLGIFRAELSRNDNDVVKAVEVAQTYLPDPNDIDAILFLESMKEAVGGRPRFLRTIQSMRRETQRRILNTAEARASNVRARATLFGFLAAIGMLGSLILPYVFGFTLGF